MESLTAQETTQDILPSLKERMQRIREEAGKIGKAASRDYEEIKKIMRNLRSRSEIAAFWNTRIGSNRPTSVKKAKKSTVKPAAKKMTAR